MAKKCAMVMLLGVAAVILLAANQTSADDITLSTLLPNGGGYWEPGTNLDDIVNTNTRYVGIGTTAPGQKLDINTVSSATDDAIVRTSSRNTKHSGMQLYSYDANGAYTGGWAIVKTPTGALEINRDASTENLASENAITIKNDTTVNVGIGTAAPKEQLQIGDRWTFHNGVIHKAIGYNFYRGGNPVRDRKILEDQSAAIMFNANGDIFLETSVSGSADSEINWIHAVSVLNNNGFVGINKLIPSATLDVGGNIKASLNNVGTGQGMKWRPSTMEIGYDVAELYDAAEDVEPADVLIVGPEGKLIRSTQPYDHRVAGIVSESPAILFEGSQLEIAPKPFKFQKGKKPPLALAGRALCRVTAEAGKIHPGDLLVTSSTPGCAMKADMDKLKPGMVIGKALDSFEKGKGKIRVLIASG